MTLQEQQEAWVRLKLALACAAGEFKRLRFAADDARDSAVMFTQAAAIAKAKQPRAKD